MSSLRLERRVGTVEKIGPGRLPDHRHRFSKLGRDGTGKGNIEPHPEEHTWGVIYRLTHEQLGVLDGFEIGYRRADLGVVRPSGPDLVRVTTFVALRVVEGLAPTDAYLSHYRDGIEEHGIEQDYLRRILAHRR
jgi:hypothetical protein